MPTLQAASDSSSDDSRRSTESAPLPAQQGLDVGSILQSAPDGISIATGVANVSDRKNRKRAFLVITLSHDMHRIDPAAHYALPNPMYRKLQEVHEALSVDRSERVTIDTILAIVGEYRKQVSGSQAD